MVSCSCCNRCEKSSKRVLYLMNGLVATSGVFLIVASLVLALQSGDVIAGLGNAGLIGPSIAGAILMVTSLLGCYGVWNENRWVLIFYFFIMFGLTFFVMATGIILLFFIQDVNNVDGAASVDFAGQIEGQINDYIVAVFNQCCGVPPINAARISGCDVADEGDACFTFLDTYQDALERVKNTGVCVALANINMEVNGVEVPIIGEFADGGCAGGDGNLFVASFSQVIQDAVEPVGAIVLSIGILLFIATITSLVVIFYDKETYEDKKGGSMGGSSRKDRRRERQDQRNFERGMAPRADYESPHQEGFRHGESIAGFNNPRYRN